ncbi:MAG: hypothetical protein KGH50_00565 [Candidatus Micrarchaeota archaeon]|nr:hypothetical protein [Candidatus Micrarchaeota archaeon]
MASVSFAKVEPAARARASAAEHPILSEMRGYLRESQRLLSEMQRFRNGLAEVHRRNTVSMYPEESRLGAEYLDSTLRANGKHGNGHEDARNAILHAVQRLGSKTTEEHVAMLVHHYYNPDGHVTGQRSVEAALASILRE